MVEKYDALIIGAGIIGSSIAFELGKLGYRTLNVDKLGEAGLGSTSNTCAIIRTTYSTMEGSAIAYDSYFSWKNWEAYLETEDERGFAKFHNTGFLALKPDDFSFDRYLEIHDKLGIPYEIWDRNILLQKMPHFTDDSFYPPRRYDDPDFGKPSTRKINDTIILFTAGGYISDAVLSVHNVQRAAENKGGRFMFNSQVTQILRSGERVTGIQLSDGTAIHAPIVINAAGPHSFVINRLAGIEETMKIKTRALRHEVHFVPSPKEFSYEKSGMVVSDGDLAGYHRPETGNLVLVGSEDPACDPQEWVEDPDHFNRDITDGQFRSQVYRLAQRIPSLPIPARQMGIVDLYDVSDDWIPIYDASDLKGFYMAVGTSGNQYKNGPTVGYMMARLIDACENGRDHDKDPVKVQLPHVDYLLDTCIFSRNREINQNSSFSVLG